MFTFLNRLLPACLRQITRNFQWTKGEHKKYKNCIRWASKLGEKKNKERNAKIHERIFHLSTRDFSPSSFSLQSLCARLWNARGNMRKETITRRQNQSLNVWHDRSLRSIVLVSCYGILRFYLLFSFLVHLFFFLVDYVLAFLTTSHMPQVREKSSLPLTLVE